MDIDVALQTALAALLNALDCASAARHTEAGNRAWKAVQKEAHLLEDRLKELRNPAPRGSVSRRP